MTNRRDFLRTAGALTLGGLLATENTWAANSRTAAKKAVGIQLYTLRDQLAKDPKGTLKQVAAAGFKELESYQGEQGIFFGMKPAEFKKFTGDLGMKMLSSHVNISEGFEKTVAEAAQVDAKYLMCPYSKEANLDAYKKKGEEFNRLGEICQKSGIQFGYHNHDYAFMPIDGVVPYDWWLENTDPKLVTMEMDIYWVYRAGKDPIDYFNKYPGRFPLWHVKDMDKANEEQNTEVGKGKLDWKKLFTHAQKSGLKQAFLEQEDNYQPDPFGSIKTSYAFLKGVSY